MRICSTNTVSHTVIKAFYAGSFILQISLKVRRKCRIFTLDVRILMLSEVAELVQVHAADRADTPAQVLIASKSTFTSLTITTVRGHCAMTPMLAKPVDRSLFSLWLGHSRLSCDHFSLFYFGFVTLFCSNSIFFLFSDSFFCLYWFSFFHLLLECRCSWGFCPHALAGLYSLVPSFHSYLHDSNMSFSISNLYLEHRTPACLTVSRLSPPGYSTDTSNSLCRGSFCTTSFSFRWFCGCCGFWVTRDTAVYLVSQS